MLFRSSPLFRIWPLDKLGEEMPLSSVLFLLPDLECFQCNRVNASGVCETGGSICQTQGSQQCFLRRMGKQWKQCQTLFSWAPKSLQMVIAAMKLKDPYSMEGKLQAHEPQPQSLCSRARETPRLGGCLRPACSLWHTTAFTSKRGTPDQTGSAPGVLRSSF